MDDQQDNEISLGAILKQAREKKGISEDDVADHLRLDKKVILKIERDEYTLSELTVFIRGYFRAYARYVDIPTEYIDNFFIKKGVADIPKQVKPATFDFNKVSLLNQKRSIHGLTYFIICVLIGLLVTWVYWQRAGNNGVTIQTKPIKIQTHLISQ